VASPGGNYSLTVFAATSQVVISAAGDRNNNKGGPVLASLLDNNKWLGGMRYRYVTGFRRIASAMVLAGLVVTFVPEARAQSIAMLPTAPPLAVGGKNNEPTAAWKEFCGRMPEECRVDLTEPVEISLTPAIWDLLTGINDRVNATIIQITDRAHWDVEDRWDYPDDGAGDCEDIQLLKRKLLVAGGLPRRAMRMTVVLDRQGAGHAVLTVRTDRGDFILDNNTSRVLPWNETGYEFLKREGSDSTVWVALGNGEARTVMASR
jgi:predicted transglutaminase-like cysteine proteinase